MADLRLILGSRNYSSWSLRAYAAARLSGLHFEEVVIHFDEDTSRSLRLAQSPSGKVPVLQHGDTVVWDSLAIAEYLAELAPDAAMWPKDRASRAHARSIAAEMHSGFMDLRRDLPMNIRQVKPWKERSPATMADIARVAAIWTGTRAQFGKRGPFLFGAPTVVDAFYAPVASRFATYAVPLEGAALDYQRAVLDWAPVKDWAAAARTEGHPLPAYDALG